MWSVGRGRSCDQTDPHYIGVPEFDWVGRYMKIGRRLGSAYYARTKRCSELWQPQHSMPADKAFLGLVKREYGGDFGVYAEVIHEGDVSVRDRVCCSTCRARWWWFRGIIPEPPTWLLILRLKFRHYWQG